MAIRLNKLLATRGIGSRRACDALIEAGSVRVNGTVIREPGTQVEPGRDRVQVHGRPIPGPSALRYVMIHKPVGMITTLDDPEGRPTIKRLLPPGPRLFPVGRLDAETSGLLIATNDGDLAHHLMHPRYGVAKVYRARLDRVADGEQLRRLRSGVEFEPGVVSGPCDVRVHSARPQRFEIEITLNEGRYRQVRRMCEAVALTVRSLHRAAYGPLRLGTLPRGAARDLTAVEVRRLRAASARPVAPRPASPKGAGVRFRPRPASPKGAGVRFRPRPASGAGAGVRFRPRPAPGAGAGVRFRPRPASGAGAGVRFRPRPAGSRPRSGSPRRSGAMPPAAGRGRPRTGTARPGARRAGPGGAPRGRSNRQGRGRPKY
ncbi:MAG: pseudouridine synthase [Candidatus Eisenbacteria bacterium]|uniref:Pseudouridine synthase n=1 Tax=Eiseniibacteriota bacterium TaxID=2212470 RepID=A0A9D6L6V8_UNCEI|nr:pseudouridine synthase [Candidatus Eisenbacteria bacterium]MBI3539716.1 pseudouridine synthase [Candidatus Eisenbacteria bacterium]